MTPHLRRDHPRISRESADPRGPQRTLRSAPGRDSDGEVRLHCGPRGCQRQRSQSSARPFIWRSRTLARVRIAGTGLHCTLHMRMGHCDGRKERGCKSCTPLGFWGAWFSDAGGGVRAAAGVEHQNVSREPEFTRTGRLCRPRSPAGRGGLSLAERSPSSGLKVPTPRHTSFRPAETRLNPYSYQ